MLDGVKNLCVYLNHHTFLGGGECITCICIYIGVKTLTQSGSW